MQIPIGSGRTVSPAAERSFSLDIVLQKACHVSEEFWVALRKKNPAPSKMACRRSTTLVLLEALPTFHDQRLDVMFVLPWC
mmetsp:Transcript_48134/g.138223  ORF Transcript_48134/g.138223 Transcript_48134/m.138223 type:complete len:81 (-) Transcript_48134:24-266(-)